MNHAESTHGRAQKVRLRRDATLLYPNPSNTQHQRASLLFNVHAALQSFTSVAMSATVAAYILLFGGFAKRQDQLLGSIRVCGVLRTDLESAYFMDKDTLRHT